MRRTQDVSHQLREERRREMLHLLLLFSTPGHGGRSKKYIRVQSTFSQQSLAKKGRAAQCQCHRRSAKSEGMRREAPGRTRSCHVPDPGPSHLLHPDSTLHGGRGTGYPIHPINLGVKSFLASTMVYFRCQRGRAEGCVDG